MATVGAANLRDTNYAREFKCLQRHGATYKVVSTAIAAKANGPTRSLVLNRVGRKPDYRVFPLIPMPAGRCRLQQKARPCTPLLPASVVKCRDRLVLSDLLNTLHGSQTGLQ